MYINLRRIVASFALFLTGCMDSAKISTSDSNFFKQFDRKLFPVTGSMISQLTPQRRSEIQLIKGVLKPKFRSHLTFTYSNEGIFAVLASYGNQRTGHGSIIVVNGCYTPPDRGCMHECSLGFETQFWTAGALMEARCADAAPIWLQPYRPLPQFEQQPTALDAPPTP